MVCDYEQCACFSQTNRTPRNLESVPKYAPSVANREDYLIRTQALFSSLTIVFFQNPHRILHILSKNDCDCSQTQSSLGSTSSYSLAWGHQRCSFMCRCSVFFFLILHWRQKSYANIQSYSIGTYLIGHIC